MALSIKDPQADKLARELARATGESLTEAVVQALRDRLDRVMGQRRAKQQQLRDEVARIQARVANLPVLDDRPADEILGYDAHGLPH